MTIRGTPNHAYTVLRSGTLSNLAWTSLTTVTMNSAGTAVFEDADATLQFPVYYRAVAN
jgi:hypothetical protein